MQPTTPPPPPPPLQGLDAREAAERLRRFGPNDTGEGRKRGWLGAVKTVAGEPMFLLLLAAAGVYLAVGDLGEGLLLGFFAVVWVGLVILQQHRGEEALDALRALAVPQARVIRGGVTQRIPSLEVVPGDLVVLSEGERIPADGVLREALAVQVDESLLTGESVPVRKLASGAAPLEQLPGGEDTPHVFAGTLAVSGHGVAEVTATGRNTQMGRIGASLAGIDSGQTPLQRQLGRLVRQFGWVAIALSALLVLGYGLLRGQWLQGLLSALAFAMAMLPEEIPMVMTVFIGLAAWRMARVKVLARRPAVVEALGAATVLCVDKTGTLTENRQKLRRLVTDTADVDLTQGGPVPEEVHALLEYGVMASRRGSADPLDAAVVAGGDRSLQGTEHLHPQWLLEKEYPLTPELLAMSQAWTRPDGSREVAAKGAAEAIADLCHLDAARTDRLLQQVHALAAEGLRVLAVARGRTAAGQPAPPQQHDYDFELLGLIGFEDPLRADVPAAVAQAHAAGMAVVMITGDHSATALAIARQAGIATAAGALTGEQVEALDDAGLRQAVREVRVFARTMPQHKLRLVQAFQANGETVAMTGDGVNDAPALKAAHIGIAMGVRGTDVAREAAGLVLLDEDFSRIVAGVRTGRRTFDNLRRAMTYITAIHVPIAGLALLPVLFGLPPLLLPAHVVLTEMIIDPACSFAFEGIAEERGIMQRPPRPAREALLGRATVWRGLAEGGVLLVVVLAIYVLTLDQGVELARTHSVLAMTAGNLVLVAANVGTAGRPGWNLPLLVVSAIAAAALGVGIAWPQARELLGFAVPSWPGMLAGAGVACGAVLLSAWLLSRRSPTEAD